jgi:hypothetical protein
VRSAVPRVVEKNGVAIRDYSFNSNIKTYDYHKMRFYSAVWRTGRTYPHIRLDANNYGIIVLDLVV